MSGRASGVSVASTKVADNKATSDYLADRQFFEKNRCHSSRFIVVSSFLSSLTTHSILLLNQFSNSLKNVKIKKDNDR